MVRMGVAPSNTTSVEVDGELTLAYRLRELVEPCATEAILATPRERLTGWRLLGGAGMQEMEDGSAMLPLPDDFLLLHSLRLDGWERSVTEIHAPDSGMGRLQGGRHSGLRGTSQRPVAVVYPHGDGRCLRLFGRHARPAELAEGWYMPMPRIADDDTIDLPFSPSALKQRLVRAHSGEHAVDAVD